MPPPTVFVCGATGSQGGAVARLLRGRGVEVHAVTRNIFSAKAQDLKTLGVKLWATDFDNSKILESAIKGCSAAFLNLMPDFTDFDAEIRQAKSIFAIAQAAGVKHVVYTTGVGVNTPEKLQHRVPDSIMARIYLAKETIENELRNAGFEYWTILRPGHFMTNYLHPQVSMFSGLVEHGVYKTALEKDTALGCADNLTIGNFATAAFLHPAKFHTQEIEFVDEFLTTDQIVAKLSAATGRNLRAVYMKDIDIEEQRISDPVVQGQLFNRDMAKVVDMEKVKSWGVPLSSLDAFLMREKDYILATFQQAA